jgi:hypothetical protein
MKLRIRSMVCIMTLSLPLISMGVLVQWDIGVGGNGHYYEVVTPGAFWSTAKIDAEGMTFLGASGHLATITSAAENTFLSNLVDDAGTTFAWIGLTDEVSEGNWLWVTGETFSFDNWAVGEPNGATGANWAFIYGSNGNWDDGHNGFGISYLVEFDVPPSAVPEPSTTMPLLGLMLGLTWVRRRRRHKA